MTTFEMEIFGAKRKLAPDVCSYTNGQTAIALDSWEEESGEWEPWGTLTVCIPEVTIPEGQILVKNWSENEGWADTVARKLGYIKTTRYVRTGFVEAFIWEKV